jgi:hypothetical protein
MPGRGRRFGEKGHLVFENHRTALNDNYLEVRWSVGQTIQGEVPQSYFSDFSAGQHDDFAMTVDCGPTAP